MAISLLGAWDISVYKPDKKTCPCSVSILVEGDSKQNTSVNFMICSKAKGFRKNIKQGKEVLSVGQNCDFK